MSATNTARQASTPADMMERMLLPDLLNPLDLARHLADANVRVQTHPAWPHLVIYNYTERAVYSKAWDEITVTCRGLIVDTSTDEVLARPFPKFWNTTEHADEELTTFACEPVEVWEKVDGSLGILHRLPDGQLAVSTRGSFTSEQAKHATRLLRDRYPSYRPPAGVTVLCEIVYPGNRIVVDYGFDDLVLLGGVNIATGRTVPFDELRAGWPGPAATRYPYESLADALAAPEQPNAEGYVIRFTGSDVRVKAKFADYVRLHRLCTGVTARIIWEHAGSVDLAATGMDARRVAQTLQMSADEVNGILDSAPGGDWMASFIDAVPEEFELWIKATAADVLTAVDQWEARQISTFAKLALDPADRRAAAAVVTTLPREQQAAMFSLLDGRSVRPLAWKNTRPAHEKPFAADPNQEQA